MKKFQYFLLCFLLLASGFQLVSPASSRAEFQKTKIAVLDFELIGDKLETQDMGAILSEWFITSIVKSGRFDVVERAMLQKILAEQKLSATGIIDDTSASQLGKILGVKVIITGSVLKIGKTIEINSRVIDVESGSIIAAENIRSSAETDLYGLVIQLTSKIMQNFPLTGYVVKRTDDSAIIDLGLGSGLSEGTEFIVYQEGEVIKHPKTGEVLDVEQIVVGRIQITRVNQNVAEGKIVSEEPPGIQYGHLVKSTQKLPGEPQPSGRYGAPIVVKQDPALVPVPKPPPVQQVPEPVKPVEPAPPKVSIKTEKKKIVAPQPPPQEQEITAVPKKESAVPEVSEGYSFGLLPWVTYREGRLYTTIVTSALRGRINDTPNAKLTKSYYELKGIDELKYKGRASDLWQRATPDVERLKTIGTNEKINATVLGKLSVVCNLEDSCTVRSFNVTIVDLNTGQYYQKSGANWSGPARDYIEDQIKAVFDEFREKTGS